MKGMRRRQPERVTLADRFWVGFGCALGGVLVAFAAMILVGVSLQDFTPRWPSFAFAAGFTGVAGFAIGPPMADVFSALLSSAYLSAGEHGLWDVDERDLPRLRFGALFLAAVLFGGTTWLSLP